VVIGTPAQLPRPPIAIVKGKSGHHQNHQASTTTANREPPRSGSAVAILRQVIRERKCSLCSPRSPSYLCDKILQIIGLTDQSDSWQRTANGIGI